MSEVERIFDRFIDAFADDLIEFARAYIDVEVAKAFSVAAKSSAKESKAEQRARKAEQRAQKRAARLAAKAKSKDAKRVAREEKRAARLAEKERIKAERIAEKQQRQVEHDRLKQERLALKQELEAERRRLREATRKRPVRQLPLDFDGLRTPPSRRGERKDPNAPPQLFVHKRKRDGQIEKLARPNDAPANGAPAVTNGASALNGAANHAAAEATPAE
jgi:hypothetical protein